jgi:peroxiredoxin
MATDNLRARCWMRYVLILAGIYNLICGGLTVLFPLATLRWLGFSLVPVYPEFWQFLGMILGVSGIGYLVAGRAPYRHWPIILVGLLGKLFGPIGCALSIGSGTLPTSSMAQMILINDIIWWIPFILILWGALRYHLSLGSAYHHSDADAPLQEMRTNTGERLDDLADAKPQLVVFLRHAGCTFCRECLADIAEQRAEIESNGCGIVLVHLGENQRDTAFFEKYGLADVPRIADKKCRLYRQFGLDLGGFSELLGPAVWVRGFMTAIIRGHGIGRIQGNSLQMPGAYLFHRRQILAGFQHARASDRPNYIELARRN